MIFVQVGGFHLTLRISPCFVASSPVVVIALTGRVSTFSHLPSPYPERPCSLYSMRSCRGPQITMITSQGTYLAVLPACCPLHLELIFADIY